MMGCTETININKRIKNKSYKLELPCFKVQTKSKDPLLSCGASHNMSLVCVFFFMFASTASENQAYL